MAKGLRHYFTSVEKMAQRMCSCVDDVVLVIQLDSPRGRWPLGRAPDHDVYPGRDGHDRAAKVACGAKTVVRPITKLIPFGIN